MSRTGAGLLPEVPDAAAATDSLVPHLRSSTFSGLLDVLGQPSKTPSEFLAGLAYGVPVTFKTIQQAYEGQNFVLQNQIINDTISFRTVLFDACPLSKVDALGARVQRRIIFPTTILDPSSTLSMTRVISYAVEEESFTIGEMNLGFEMEQRALQAPDAAMMITQYTRTLTCAFARAMQYTIVRELLLCQHAYAIMASMRGAKPYEQLMSMFNLTTFMIHKDYRGMATIWEYINDARKLRQARPVTMFLAPPGTQAQLALGSTYFTQASQSGDGALSRLEQGSNIMNNWNGIPFQVLERERLDYTNAPPYSPLERDMSIALYGTSTNDYLHTFSGDGEGHNTASLRSPSIMMLGEGDMRIFPVAQLIHGDQYLDAESGLLRDDIITKIADEYKEILRDMGVEARRTTNGDPFIDPHIAFSTDNRPYAIRYFGEQDPDVFSNITLFKAAEINHAVLTKKIGKDNMAKVEAMHEVLQTSAMQGLPEDNDANVAEAFTKAVALHYLNAPVAGTNLTRGNAYGGDHIPPLFVDNGVRYIGTRVAEAAGIEAVVYDAAANRYDVGLAGGVLVRAPDFPPFHSSGNHAATIAAAYNNRGVDAQTWLDNPVTEAKFRTVAEGWAIMENRYFPAQQKVFSPMNKERPELGNLLMNPDSCPYYVRPRDGSNKQLLSLLAYYQQAHVGFRLPLAVEVTAGAGAAARPSGLRVNTQGYADQTAAALQSSVANGTAVGLDGALRVLLGVSFLAPLLKADLTEGRGRTFSEKITAAMNGLRDNSIAVPVNGAGVALVGYNAVERFFGGRIGVLENRTLSTMLTSGNATQIATATEFINRVYNVLLLNTDTPTYFTDAWLGQITQRMSSTIPDLSTKVLLGITDSSRPGQSSSSQLSAAMSSYQASAAPVAGVATDVRYIITRLQPSATIFSNVSPRRVYQCTLRPTAVSGTVSAVMNPRQGDATAYNANVALQAAAVNVRNRGRGGMDDGLDGLGPVSIYTHGGALVEPTGALATSDTNARAYGGADPARTFTRGGGDRYDSSAYDLAGRIRGDADPYHPLADSVLFDTVLHQSTHSRWMQARIGAIATEMSDPLHQAMALTMITSVICRQTLLAMVTANYVLLRSYVLLWAAVSLRTGTLIALSPQVGASEFAFPDLSIGKSATTLALTFRFSVEAGVYVTDPRSVTTLPAFKLAGYNGGQSSHIVTPGRCYSDAVGIPASGNIEFDARRIKHNRKDLLVFGTGVDYTLPADYPIGGRYDQGAYSGPSLTPEAAQMMRQLATCISIYANIVCGLNKMTALAGYSAADAQGAAWNDMFLSANQRYSSLIAYQMRQANFNPKTRQHTVYLSSHAGPLGGIAPGQSCAAALRGLPGMICPQKETLTMESGTIGSVLVGLGSS